MMQPANTPPCSFKIVGEAKTAEVMVSAVQVKQVAWYERMIDRNDKLLLNFSVSGRLPDTEISFAKRWPVQRYKTAGKLFIQPPGHGMKIRSGPGNLNLILCQLSPSFIGEAFDEDFDWSDEHLDLCADAGNSDLCHLMMKLGSEARRPGFARDAMMEALAMQIVVVMSRRFRLETLQKDGLLAWQLRAIDDRVEDKDAPTLTELAKICRLSIRQVSRRFLSSKGIPIGKYVAEKRLRQARLQLAQGESVKAVAYNLGFSSPSSFCSAFKKFAGVTPGHYRRAFT